MTDTHALLLDQLRHLYRYSPAERMLIGTAAASVIESLRMDAASYRSGMQGNAPGKKLGGVHTRDVTPASEDITKGQT